MVTLFMIKLLMSHSIKMLDPFNRTQLLLRTGAIRGAPFEKPFQELGWE